jgi:hypothetical protein
LEPTHETFARLRSYVTNMAKTFKNLCVELGWVRQ